MKEDESALLLLFLLVYGSSPPKNNLTSTVHNFVGSPPVAVQKCEQKLRGVLYLYCTLYTLYRDNRVYCSLLQ